jgi:hypothetical protein
VKIYSFEINKNQIVFGVLPFKNNETRVQPGKASVTDLFFADKKG